jgi:integrase
MRGHVRKRGKTWCLVVDNGRDPQTCRRRQKWFSGYKTRGEAEDALVDILGKAKRSETLDPDKTPLADYLTAWVEGRRGELAPLSITQYQSVIRTDIAPHALGGTPLAKLRKSHLRAFQRELEQKGLAPATRNVVHAVVHKGLAEAVADDLLAVNPAVGAGAKAKRTPTRRFTVWTDEELRSFLEIVEADRLAGLWRLAVATGARRSELLGCTWLGYDAEARRLTISQQVVPTRGGVTVTPCKTAGSHRTVTLDEETVAWLERHREAQIEEKDAAGLEVYLDNDLIFADAIGRPLNPQRITEAFAKHRSAAGIRPGRLHDLRHSHATHLLTRGIPVHIVAARLGHSSPMITLSTYAHVLPKTDELAADVMAAVLERAAR